MDAFLVILAIIVIKDCVFGRQKTQDEYLSVSNTTAIKGLFTILIVFSHFVTYYPVNPLDGTYRLMKTHLSQAVVIPYLFYSGYGMICRVEQKGKDYMRTIITRRVPSFLIGVACALVCYLVLGVIRNKFFSLSTILLSLIGWESLGNSNWYIFGILGEYLIFWISFQVIRIRDNRLSRLGGLLLTTLLTGAFVVWIRSMGRPTWCYDTLLMFPLGVAWGLYHQKLDRFLHEHDILWILSLVLIFAVYMFSFGRRGSGLKWYTVWCVAFALMMVLLSMRMHLGGPVLNFFGKHIFSIYILQRISMILLSDLGWAEQMPHMSLILAMLATSLIAVVFDQLMDRLNRKLRLK